MTDPAGAAMDQYADLLAPKPANLTMREAAPFLPRVSGLAGANLDVERVDRAGFDPDQNLPRQRMRPRHWRNPERRAICVENGGLHRLIRRH
jgi:hypothetical protein